MGQHQQEIVAGGALKRILLVLSVAALMAGVMSVMAAPAFAIFPGNGDPHPNKGSGHANPPTDSASNGCKAFSHTPTNEPAFFQSDHVTC